MMFIIAQLAAQSLTFNYLCMENGRWKNSLRDPASLCAKHILQHSRRISIHFLFHL